MVAITYQDGGGRCLPTSRGTACVSIWGETISVHLVRWWHGLLGVVSLAWVALALA